MSPAAASSWTSTTPPWISPAFRPLARHVAAAVISIVLLPTFIRSVVAWLHVHDVCIVDPATFLPIQRIFGGV